MPWYKKVLKKNRKEMVSSAILLTIFALAILLWHFLLGKSFEWQSISPIDAPTLFSRVFYSALVFATLGAFLYWIKFYRFLHTVLVRGLGDWELYRGVKALIWIGLILIMYFWIVPGVVNLLNAVISFLFNILNLILYIAPPLGISIIVFVVSVYLYGQLKRKA